MTDSPPVRPQPLPPPPGWFPDPGGSGGLRWWDGQGWTEHVSAPAAAAPAAAAAEAAVPPAMPAAPVSRRYEQKWWHLPLVAGLATLATVGWIVAQILTA